MVRVEERYPGKIMEELREQKKGGPSPDLAAMLIEALRDEETAYSMYSNILEKARDKALYELETIIEKILLQEYEHAEALKRYMREHAIIP